MLESFVDAPVTEWAQSINLSRGWTNFALGAHASTYSIGIPERHLFTHPFTECWLMQSRQSLEIVIRCDLTVKGLRLLCFLIYCNV
jgi:hypothetical protein